AQQKVRPRPRRVADVHDTEGTMEAKVDIRKLQLLNDRINQTIEALNQVRLSVHGISHTNPLQGQLGQLQGQDPFGGFGVNPFYGMQQQMPGFVPGYGQGFSHTSGAGWGGNPFLGQINPLLAQVNPLLAQQEWAAQQGLGVGGLGHTSPEQIDMT